MPSKTIKPEPASQDTPITKPSTSSFTVGAENSSQIWSETTLDFLEDLPRPWTRGLLYTMILFTSIVIPWTMLAKVDEVGTAQGRLEPKSRPIELDSPITCTVVAIPIAEGSVVSTNQVIGECDAELINNDLTQNQQKLAAQNQQLHQLGTLLNQLQITYQTQAQQNQAQASEQEAKVKQAQDQIKSLTANYELAKAEKETQLKQSSNSVEVKKTNYRSTAIILETAQEKIPRHQKAYDAGVLPFENLQETLQSEKEKRQQLEQARLEVKQAELYHGEQESNYQKMQQESTAKIAEARLILAQEEQSYQSITHANQLALLKITEQIKKNQGDITNLQADINETKTKIASLEKQLEQYVFRSPLEGIIYSLPVKEPGSVIQVGDLFASIAPQNAELILRAEIPAAESGFIELGQTVKLKFDAYPFQDYGVLEGNVNWISPTSKIQENMEGKVKLFEVEIAIKNKYINGKDGPISLKAGQTATAEIVVRKRRVIDFILEPFQKLQNTGLEL